ncbi:MAG: hypothetical protein ACXACY_27155 [Candidatus Hodarchaeales archaeon]|jgi:hypothetical protein
MGYDIKPYRKCCKCGRKSVNLNKFEETATGEWICTGKEKQICKELCSRCWFCGGNGKDPHFDLNICPECRGSGYSSLY